MKKFRVFRKFDSPWEIVFAAVTPIALFIAACVLFTFERELYQLIALFCVLLAGVAAFTVFNLFHGMRAAIACFVAVELMCSSLIFCAVSPAIVNAAAAGAVYESPSVERDIFKDKNVMVFVPHQDDELNILSGVIEEYVSAGSKVRIVYMTYGDYWGLQETRVSEALNVASFYGIDSSDVIFFGYGDQWEGTHIYNMAGDEVATSHNGKNATYDVNGVTPYRHESYTRNNLLNDFESVITEYMPDTLFCIDYDTHNDHIANSLLFEEAMGNVLKANEGYNPTVYKAFGYSTAWYAVEDFYDCDNVLSTVSTSSQSFLTENNCYNWADRVRFPVATSSLGFLMSGTTTYRGYALHASQDTSWNMIRVINSDKVFFQRDTSSLVYKADITVSSSSEDAYKLNDFKIVDTLDVNMEYNNDFCAGVWCPDEWDNDKEVTVKFSSPQDISCIRLYDSPSVYDNVLSAEITLSDGTEISCEDINKNGAATDITFNKKHGISGFTVRITSAEGTAYGFSEVEAYSTLPDYSADAYVKIQDTEGTFAYEYTMPSAEQTFSLYAYECSSLVSDYTVSVEGDISATVEDGVIKVTCATDKEGILTVTNKKNGVSDSVKITNPNAFVRLGRNILRQMERYYSYTLRTSYYQSLCNFVINKIKY